MNELQKQHRLIEAQAGALAALDRIRSSQAAEIEAMKLQLAAQSAQLGELRQAVEALLTRSADHASLGSDR